MIANNSLFYRIVLSKTRKDKDIFELPVIIQKTKYGHSALVWAYKYQELRNQMRGVNITVIYVEPYM